MPWSRYAILPELHFATLERSRSQHLWCEFDYGGVPFQVDTDLAVKVTFSAGSSAWHWWFGSDADAVGIGLGATYYTVELGLSGSAAVNDQTAAASTS